MLVDSRLFGTALLLGTFTVISPLSSTLAADEFAESIANVVHAAVNEEGGKETGEGAAETEAKHQNKQLAEDQADNKENDTKAEKSDETANEKSSDSKDSAEKSENNATAAPKGASVRIISPTDGEEVSSPVKVVFGLTGMGVAPAGVEMANTGHHHIIIDGGDELPKAGEPMTDNVKHFGGGQTEAELKLDKGTHTLQLIMGDKNHAPHNPPIVSEKITITVK
jgi:hypothetical protein